MTTVNRLIARGRFVILLTLAVALVLGLTSVAAFANGEPEPIRGCIDNGKVMIIGADETCKEKETLIEVPTFADFEALRAALAQEVGERQTADTALQNQIDALEANLQNERSERAAADQAMAQQVAALQAQINSLNNQVSILASQVGSLQAQVAGLAAQVATLVSRISALENAVFN